MRSIRYFYCLLAIVSLLTFASCSTSNTDSTVDIKSLRQAINQDDVESFKTFFKEELHIRKHEWISADDGYGFILGHARDYTLNAKNNADILELLRSINITGTEPQNQTNFISTFTQELSGIEKQWQHLDVYLFMRGMADVEHIVLLGFNKQTHKLSALYIN